MGKFLRLINGIPKSVEESGSPTIYDRTITIVASSPGTDELVGPISAGTSITLPGGQTYTGDELNMMLNGIDIDNVLDYNTTSSTQIQMTYSLEVGDKLRFFIDRGP
jgi:hypothetical protein